MVKCGSSGKHIYTKGGWLGKLSSIDYMSTYLGLCATGHILMDRIGKANHADIYFERLPYVQYTVGGPHIYRSQKQAHGPTHKVFRSTYS
jgi:hypothetical protein